MRKTVSAIVPILNEEKTLVNVVDSLLKSEFIDEVICVNDGSTDNTLQILKGFGEKIQVISLKENKGKAFALVEGIKLAKGEIISFWDADLINLSQENITSLLKPILEEKTRVILGYPVKTSYSSNVCPLLTGERAYLKKDLIPFLERMRNIRYGVETFLNNSFKKKEIKRIPLTGVVGLSKYEKMSFSKAVKEYIQEGMEIAREMSKKEILSPEDYKIIETLNKSLSFKDLKLKIKSIKNVEVKKILEKYVLTYIKSIISE